MRFETTILQESRGVSFLVALFGKLLDLPQLIGTNRLSPVFPDFPASAKRI